jgi:hypothetical protein
MPMGVAELNGLLKEQYPIDKIELQINNAKVFIAQLKKHSKTIDITGKRAIVPVQMGLSQGIGPRGEWDDLPEAQHSSVEDSTLKIVPFHGRIMVSGLSMELSDSNVGAFARSFDFEVSSCFDAFNRDINRALINGWGLGVITAISNGQTLTGATSMTVNNTTDLYENMAVDIYTSPTSNGGTVISLNNFITSVDDENKTITLRDAITVTTATPSATYILRQGAKGKDPMGLKGIIDNGSYVSNLQGIDRNQFPRWKAGVFGNSGTLRQITDTILQPAFTKVEKTGKVPGLILMEYALRDSLAAQELTYKRFERADSIELKGGYKGLSYNGGAIVCDEQMDADRVYFIRPDLLEICQTRGPRWDDTTGKIIKDISGKDAYEARLKWYMNMGCNRCNAQAVVLDLK